jgi:hypothetical protein
MAFISRRLIVGAAVVLAAAPALTSFDASAQEKAVAPEKNPPGDIPDDQVFITYTSPKGFALKVPEGWGRSDTESGVLFADKYGEIRVDVGPSTSPLSAAAAKSHETAALAQFGRAVKVTSVNDVRLPSGSAVVIAYTSNSEPNPVTGKRIRLENERYLFAHGPLQAALTLSAPAGADNADQWKLIAESFRWK